MERAPTAGAICISNRGTIRTNDINRFFKTSPRPEIDKLRDGLLQLIQNMSWVFLIKVTE